MVSGHRDSFACFVSTPDWHNFFLEFTGSRSCGGFLVTVEGKLILRLAADALRLRQKLRRDAHVQSALAGDVKQLGIEVDTRVHGDVVHVFQPAHNLHVLAAGQD